MKWTSAFGIEYMIPSGGLLTSVVDRGLSNMAGNEERR